MSSPRPRPVRRARAVAPTLLGVAPFDLFQPRLLVGLVAGAVAWKTRNAGFTLVVGMGILIALEAL